MTSSPTDIPHAQVELLARQLDRLRIYVSHRLGPALARRVEPDDVVQEACARAWRELRDKPVLGEQALYGLLVTVARHVIVDLARAARARKRDGGAQLERSSWSRCGAEELAAVTAGPFTRAARSEEQQRLFDALRRLSPQHQRILLLRQFEQRSAREAAERLGITEGAAHALFRRALGAWAEAARLEKS